MVTDLRSASRRLRARLRTGPGSSPRTRTAGASAGPEKSVHILGTSANLLGLCFIVLTSLRALHASDETIIDEVTALAMVLFMASCLLSFMSLRAAKRPSSARLEWIADNLFLVGLCLLFITTMLISFQVVA